MKLTKWHKKGVKPVHIGIYEVNDYSMCSYAYWNGERFGYRVLVDSVDSIMEAYLNKNCYTAFPKFAVWRGLAEKP